MPPGVVRGSAETRVWPAAPSVIMANAAPTGRIAWPGAGSAELNPGRSDRPAVSLASPTSGSSTSIG